MAIITGAGQGIGEAYAHRFAKEGATVVVADVNAEKGEAVARAIGGSAVFERVDVSDEADTQRLAQTVFDRTGKIDVLLNNAAIFYGIDNFDTSTRSNTAPPPIARATASPFSAFTSATTTVAPSFANR